jgi:muconolactone delta-isomerase
MSAFMAVATFQEGTNMDEVFAVREEESKVVHALQGEGRMGAVSISLERGTVFLEITAPDEAKARETVLELPMSRWWNIEIFPLITPTISH